MGSSSSVMRLSPMYTETVRCFITRSDPILPKDKIGLLAKNIMAAYNLDNNIFAFDNNTDEKQQNIQWVNEDLTINDNIQQLEEKQDQSNAKYEIDEDLHDHYKDDLVTLSNSIAYYAAEFFINKNGINPDGVLDDITIFDDDFNELLLKTSEIVKKINVIECANLLKINSKFIGVFTTFAIYFADL